MLRPSIDTPSVTGPTNISWRKSPESHQRNFLHSPVFNSSVTLFLMNLDHIPALVRNQ